jgi:general secretion pathway protein J
MLGLTLIELMVALGLFAVLGVLSYRAVSAAAEGRQHLAADFQRWRDIARLFQIAESDLMQIVARPGAAGSGDRNSLILVQDSAGGTALSFLKLDGARNSVRRRGYRLDQNRVVLLRWPGVDTLSAPTEDVVLENVTALRISLLTQGGQKATSWPVDAASGTLPIAVDVELELPDAGTIRRLFALR